MEATQSAIRTEDIPLSQIERDEDQPRKDFGDIAGLAQSIKEQGLIYPIIVTPNPATGGYRIVAGERRYRACVLIGLPTIKAIISPITDPADLSLLQVIENIQRKGFTAIEEARAVQKLIKSKRISQKDVAKSIGVAASNVSQLLSILRIPSDVLDDLQTSEWATKSALIELAKYRTKERKHDFSYMLAKLKAGTLTVREARRRGRYQKRITSRTYEKPGMKVIVRATRGSGLADERKALEETLALVQSRLKEIA